MPSDLHRKPSTDQLDLYGLTHRGLTRPENEDHFLVCTLERQVVVHRSSLTDLRPIAGCANRVATLAMVADGAGGGAAGEQASRLAVEATTRYVAESMQCFYSGDCEDESFAQSLRAAAMRCHAGLLAQADEDPALHGMATTLTLWMGVWPRAYLLQVGDSRCYLLRGGQLRQISRDQTMAQELVDLGAIPDVGAASPRLAHTLSSALGGPQTEPVVTRFTLEWGDVGLLCSDGLTRHVSNERIRERLCTMRSAREACEALVQDALDAGGSDNVTVVVGRTPPAPGE